MEKTIPCVMLIDDDFATNIYNEVVLEDTGYAKNIVIQDCAEDALDYLTAPFSEAKPNPNLIFLDINMPTMNGWDFLEAYSSLEDEQKQKNIIIMLSTTSDPQEIEKAGNIAALNGIRSKPLTAEIVEDIMESFFAPQPKN